MSTFKATIKVDQWIDFHAHYFPPMSEEQSMSVFHACRAGKFMISEPPTWSVEGQLDYMNRAGVAMELLSYIPKNHETLKASNDFGAGIVSKHPTRFGLLAALPTDDASAAIEEIKRAQDVLQADGFAVTTDYNGVILSDPRLAPMWAELDKRRGVVFVHPNGYGPASLGRPSPLIEVAFETCRVMVDLLYTGVFRNYPNVTFVVAHCGGALPALVGRILTLGTQSWVPNPNNITKEEIKEQLARLYFDTAATGTAHTLGPALCVTSADHIVYGADCGVPCCTEETIEENIKSILAFDGWKAGDLEGVGRGNALRLLPSLAKRLQAK